MACEENTSEALPIGAIPVNVPDYSAKPARWSPADLAELLEISSEVVFAIGGEEAIRLAMDFNEFSPSEDDDGAHLFVARPLGGGE